MYLRQYLCEQLFKESADESSDFVSIQQVKLSFRVSVVVNYSVSITVKRTATLPWVHPNAFTETGGERQMQDGRGQFKTASIFLMFKISLGHIHLIGTYLTKITFIGTKTLAQRLPL